MQMLQATSGNLATKFLSSPTRCSRLAAVCGIQERKTDPSECAGLLAQLSLISICESCARIDTACATVSGLQQRPSSAQSSPVRLGVAPKTPELTGRKRP